MKLDHQSGPAPGGRQAGERRDSERVQSRHEVVFSDYAAKGPLRSGSVTDMSAGGLRIATHYPESSGEEVQIELKPLPDSTAPLTIIRGRVAHVIVPENGASLMGVQILPKSPKAWQGVPAFRLSRPADTLFARRRVASPRAKSTRIRQTSRSRAARLAMVPLLGLVLIFLLLMREAVDGERRGGRGGYLTAGSAISLVDSELSPALPSDEVVPTRIGSSSSTDGLEAAAPFEWNQAGGVDALLSNAQAALGQGDLAAAEALFTQLKSRRDANPVQRFASELGYAEAAAARGQPRLAKAVLAKAMRLGDSVPAPWRDAARDLESRLSEASGKSYSPTPMGTVLGLEQLAGSDAAMPPLRIEVDARRYTLSIMKGNRVLGSFPVGLGRNGTTPLGTFQIANKIVDPDWYNRGEVVPAGDARNPLGSRWMGLGKGTKATSYGIHPTEEADSIGRALSAGCVRMRPEDAETVYRLAPIGTTVHIFR